MCAFSLPTCDDKIDDGIGQISTVPKISIINDAEDDKYDVQDNPDECEDQVEQGKVCYFFAGILFL